MNDQVQPGDSTDEAQAETEVVAHQIDVREINKQANAYIDLHLRQLCSELVTLDSTGVLPDDRLRDLAAIVSPLETFNPIGLATGMVKTTAVRVIASRADV